GKTGSVYGALMAMLTILKAQPSSYNRDLQEDKIHVFNASDTVGACLDMATAIVSNTQFNTRQIAAGLDAGFLEATALAEYLVKKGVPFRQGHGVVGSLVAACEKEGKKLSEMSIEQLQKACGVIEQDVYESLSPAGVTKHYVTKGAASPEQVSLQVEYWKNQLKEQ
ncbi:MAG: hypothetical protein JW912_06360, partial [Sedimentisphaerales bacterium]|nr:hypothetical protein [Sedimentisphaerales bacterium]